MEGCAHLGAVRRPGAPQQVLLEVVLVARHELDAALGRREGPHVPDAQRAVHRVGQQVRPVVR